MDDTADSHRYPTLCKERVPKLKVEFGSLRVLDTEMSGTEGESQNTSRANTVSLDTNEILWCATSFLNLGLYARLRETAICA